MARKRVWVLWARTWNNGDTRLHKVTSKKAWQKYVGKIKAKLKDYELRGYMPLGYVEGVPKFYQEGADKAALEIMRDLAQPLTKGN